MGKNIKQIRRAQEAARINRLNRDTTDIFNGLSTLCSGLEDRVEFREIDDQQVLPFWHKWADEYRAAGGIISPGGGQAFLSYNQRRAWAVVVDGQDQGFLVVHSPYQDLPDFTAIEIVWIDPAVRSQGIATYTYLWARHHFDAEGIELEIGRAKKSAYWRALGFSYYATFPNQRGHNHSLCQLVTPAGRAKVGAGLPLAPWVVDESKANLRRNEVQWQKQQAALQTFSKLMAVA